MNNILTQLRRLMLFVALLLVNNMLVNSASAAELDCPVEQQINTSFDNGAGWSMCWDSRKRENIVLSQVHYKAPNAEPYSVFNSLRLSQLHVSYDDSNVNYNDVTQFGLGGGYVTTLEASDCPNGRLIEIATRPSLCELVSIGDDSYQTANEVRQSQSLTLFSTSQVGAYAYLITWKFFADGSVQPSVGAAGALQRSTDDPHSHFGRELEGVDNKSWLSHTHNYYWQIDFDLGENANNDEVSEIQFTTDAQGRRARSMTRFAVESARATNPQTMTSWLISDGNAELSNAPSYLIEPINHGHKYLSTESKPFTEFDFFVTKQSDCERFISENAKYYPDCYENILQFVNNESLVNEDIVVWHNVSFHHVPRNEDRSVMHSHWDGFVMEARNLQTSTPGHSGLVSDTTLAAMANPDQSSSSETNSSETKKSGFGCSISSSSNKSQGGGVELLLLLLMSLLRHKTQIVFFKPRQIRKHRC